MQVGRLLRIAARVTAQDDPQQTEAAPKKTKKYLLFTSGSGSAVWELPAGVEAALKPLIDAYNQESAWEARGQDGTASVVDQAGLMREFEGTTNMQELRDSVENWGGPVDQMKATQLLDGTFDGLTGEPYP